MGKSHLMIWILILFYAYVSVCLAIDLIASAWMHSMTPNLPLWVHLGVVIGMAFFLYKVVVYVITEMFQ